VLQVLLLLLRKAKQLLLGLWLGLGGGDVRRIWAMEGTKKQSMVEMWRLLWQKPQVWTGCYHCALGLSNVPHGGPDGHYAVASLEQPGRNAGAG